MDKGRKRSWTYCQHFKYKLLCRRRTWFWTRTSHWLGSGVVCTLGLGRHRRETPLSNCWLPSYKWAGSLAAIARLISNISVVTALTSPRWTVLLRCVMNIEIQFELVTMTTHVSTSLFCFYQLCVKNLSKTSWFLCCCCWWFCYNQSMMDGQTATDRLHSLLACPPATVCRLIKTINQRYTAMFFCHTNFLRK